MEIGACGIVDFALPLKTVACVLNTTCIGTIIDRKMQREDAVASSGICADDS